MFASKRQFRSSCHLCEKGFVVEVIGKNIQARSCLKILMAAFAMSMMVMVFAPMQAEAWTLHKSFSGVRNGFESGRWWDGSSGLTWVNTSRCSTDSGAAAHRTLMMEVRMDNSFRPDASFGVRDARGCYWSVAHNSFPVVAGNHYYKVGGLQGWQRISGATTLDF
jgi:hypothetical protein